MARLDYFSAACPAPWQILGVKLRPFSLGHYLKLRRLECAFVSDGPDSADLGDLVLGLAVCSMSSHPDPNCDEFWRWLERPARWTLPGMLFGLGKMTPAEMDCFRFGRKLGALGFKQKALDFASYIEAHTEEPGYWKLKDDEKGEAGSGAHWAHAVIADLISECGYSQFDALNAPFGRCLHDYFRALERNGLVRLKTEYELAIEREVGHG